MVRKTSKFQQFSGMSLKIKHDINLRQHDRLQTKFKNQPSN